VSPNQVIPVENGALSPIAERVLKVPSLTYEYGTDGIVIAVKDELIVRTIPFNTSSAFRNALLEVADRVGSLAQIQRSPTTIVKPRSPWWEDGGPARPKDHPPAADGPLSKLEIWRLKDARTRNSIDESRRLRPLALQQRVKTSDGRDLVLPAISPNHVAILSATAGGCPAAPPKPAPPPDGDFVLPPSPAATAKVTILDSGYIWTHPPHHNLDQRVTVVHGQWLDTNTTPPSWKPDKPDGVYRDPRGQLDGISGHGTFIAGLIAHIAPDASLEAVGLRNQEVEIPGHMNRATQLGLFETEAAIAHAMLQRCDTDVIQCGFAFPTLDDYPSLPFAAVMDELRQPSAPHNGGVAVVAPAGNERSRRRYWPAALPDVIGVASTNRRGNARAWFSNWGDWCDCCTRGEHVYSTFVDFDGSVEGEPLTDIEHFRGWARWDGTSFAAPKVSAAIAKLLPASSAGTRPVDAWNDLITGAGGVPISSVTDATLSGPPGVSLRNLHIW
jgi:hypothetical protein